MESYSEKAKWPTCKQADIACAGCGKKKSCTVAPDGNAFKCWRDGGRIIQVDQHHQHDAKKRFSPAVRSRKSTKGFATVASTFEAIRRSIEGAALFKSWTYFDAGCKEVFAVARFNLANGDKTFRPIHLAANGWRIGDPPGVLPLYRLPDLREEGGTVFVCEGEKAADAAVSLGLCATTSAHGSASADRSDWTPLANTDVTILPDADEAGRHYADSVAKILLALTPPARVKIVALPGLPVGGDIVEFSASRQSQNAEAIRAEIESLSANAPIAVTDDTLSGPVLTCFADIEPRVIQWLWRNRIPLGRITLFVGKPGCGKSFATTDVAARVSTGSRWPDGAECPLGSAIFITCEDDPHDTIRPRLDIHRADTKRIHLLSGVSRVLPGGKKTEVMFTLADVAALESALQKTPDCKLVIIDPIGSFLGGRTDAHRDNEVRAVLAPVARLAEKYGVAVLIVMHTRKAAGESADDLALGSRAFTGIARAIWHVMPDPSNKARKLMLPGKNNLAPEGTGLAFAIQGRPIGQVNWEPEPVQMSADDALAIDSKPGPEAQTRRLVAEWLRELLAAGPMRVGDVRKPEPGTIAEAAKAAGYSWATVRRAKDILGIKPFKDQFSGGWYWKLPPQQNDCVTEGVQDDPAPFQGLEPEHLEHLRETASENKRFGIPDAEYAKNAEHLRPAPLFSKTYGESGVEGDQDGQVDANHIQEKKIA